MVVLWMLNEWELSVWDGWAFHIIRTKLLLLVHLNSIYLKVFRDSLDLQFLA